MTISMGRWSACGAAAGVALSTVVALAQTDRPAIQPLRSTPTEALTVNPGFRDWSPVTIAGTTIIGGNQTGGGGVFAIDAATGKVKWTVRPVFNGGTAGISTAPGVSGQVVVFPFASGYPGAVVAVSLATGKELWRGPDPVVDAAVAVSAGLAYIMGKDGAFHALDAATGHEQWKAALSTRGGCASAPIVRDDTVYVTGHADATPGDSTKPAGDYLVALDAITGQERWRYHPVAPDAPLQNVCLGQPVVSADTVFASENLFLYAVNRATGKEHWKPLEIRRPSEGRERGVELHGLVDADTVLVGMTSEYLMAIDKTTGRVAWDLAGQYNVSRPSIAVVGRVLYFQGSPGAKPGELNRGTLHALDLDTRAVLWSFTRPTGEANWPFGHVTPFDGGLWVDSYQALVKLR